MIDQRKEEQWDDYFAKDDAIRERYHAEIQDMRREAILDAEHYDYMHLVQEAGFGEDHQAYESCWKRTLKYYEDQGL